jgi:hypothetical protein
MGWESAGRYGERDGSRERVRKAVEKETRASEFVRVYADR